MPLDPFAALNAMIRAEAARSDASNLRRRAPSPGGGSDDSGWDSEPIATADRRLAERRSLDPRPVGRRAKDEERGERGTVQ
ncbi:MULTISPECIES: hypothetical protein [unclassified Streptomyces]|uniref:hypothetical protein n=1 Tax=unclassified Streptomyces TaxID=2593676 RepID=UPI00201F3B95|nr:hypothetical protein [Streptomyces sp. 35G-GA-8]MCL7375570.1 hypothetical protein [Streptomyces sp. 35G-GA-8]